MLLAGCMAVDPSVRTTEHGQAIYRLSSEGSGAAEIQIGTIGHKGHIVRDLAVRPIRPVCNKKAYVTGFRNSFVDRWDTNVMMDRLSKSYYIDQPVEDTRPYTRNAKNDSCGAESLAQGEADGNHAAKRLYQKFYQELSHR